MKLKNQMLALAALVVLTGCTQNDQPGKTDKPAAPVVITNMPAPAAITNSKPAEAVTNNPPAVGN